MPLVVEVQESEHNNVEELEEVKGEMDVTGKQLKEREDRLVQTELDLIRREKLVKEKEHELKGKDVQLKLKKGLWIKEEEERKKREEEQEKEKKELEQWKRNQQERKIQAELRIINNEERGHENRKEYLQEEEFQLWIWEKRANTQWRERMHFVQKKEEDIKKRMRIVQQMEQENQRSKEQELEQREIETLIKTKDDEIKERQLRIHEKGKELEHRENNLQKFKERTHQGLLKQREQCEEVKGKEIIVLEKEREIRAREYDLQWREKNVLGREIKVKTPVKLVQDEVQGKTKGEQMEKEIQTVEEKHQEGKSHRDDELQQEKQHGVEGAHHMQDLQQVSTLQYFGPVGGHTRCKHRQPQHEDMNLNKILTFHILQTLLFILPSHNNNNDNILNCGDNWKNIFGGKVTEWHGRRRRHFHAYLCKPWFT